MSSIVIEGHKMSLLYLFKPWLTFLWTTFCPCFIGFIKGVNIRVRNVYFTEKDKV